jgi:hypothetical protein
MVFDTEKRKHQRQHVLLPLRVADGELTGKVLYEGVTLNVAPGGVYFRTYGWRDLKVGSPVVVSIDVPPEMFQVLPSGGMTGRGTVIRVEKSGQFARLAPEGDEDRPTERGVALRFDGKLAFESGAGALAARSIQTRQDLRA